MTHGRGNQQRSVDSIDALNRSRKALLGKAERSSQAIRIKTSGTLWTDPPKRANGSAQAEPTFSDRNRRWRKSHHKKNLTAPHSKGCENCESGSRADRGQTDRQLIFGIQNRQPSVYMRSCHPFKSFGDYQETDCATFGLPEVAFSVFGSFISVFLCASSVSSVSLW